MIEEVTWRIEELADKKFKIEIFTILKTKARIEWFICETNEEALKLAAGVELEKKRMDGRLSSADVSSLLKSAEAFERCKPRCRFAQMLRKWADRMKPDAGHDGAV